jgi:nucleoside 2-deoxyribosyltransferase
MYHRIYLSGPMTGLTIAEASGWRNFVKEKLYNIVEFLDPLRDIIKDSNCIITDSLESIDKSLETDKGIFFRDYNDIMTSTIIFANLLDAKKPSIGTVSEIAWAYMKQIPVIGIIENHGNPHDVSFIREMISFRVDSLERGISVVKSIIGL